MTRAALSLLAALALAACGDTAQHRMVSGALMGAGAGALLGGFSTPQHMHPPRRW